MNQPVRILHIFGRMNRGGAEMRTLDLMRCIDRDTYRFEYCVLSARAGDLDGEIVSLGGSIHYCKLNWRFPFRFLRLLRSERFDVVHSHVWLVSGIILILARMAGIKKRIAHFRTTGTDEPQTWLRARRDAFLRWMIDISATDILAVSEGAMEAGWSSVRATDKRCRVIYNGVVTERSGNETDRPAIRSELGIADDCHVFIHVGRFSRPKNHARLVSIFAALHAVDPNAILLLIGGGEGPERERIKQMTLEKGIAAHVKFLGVRRDVARLLKSADAMVFPSVREGLPGTVLEACAVGTPVLATNLPGVLEIAREVSLVTPKSLADSDMEWASEALKIIERKLPAEIATDRLQESVFSMDKCVELYKEVWRGA